MLVKKVDFYTLIALTFCPQILRSLTYECFYKNLKIDVQCTLLRMFIRVCIVF